VSGTILGKMNACWTNYSFLNNLMVGGSTATNFYPATTITSAASASAVEGGEPALVQGPEQSCRPLCWRQCLRDCRVGRITPRGEHHSRESIYPRYSMIQRGASCCIFESYSSAGRRRAPGCGLFCLGLSLPVAFSHRK